jgi:hypothetical protein
MDSGPTARGDSAVRGGVESVAEGQVQEAEFHAVQRLAGQAVGVKEVDHGTWLVSLTEYDLGYIDLEEKTLQPLENPFGPKVLPMS